MWYNLRPILLRETNVNKGKLILLNPPGDKLYVRDYYCSFSSKADYCWPPQDLLYLSGILDEDFKVEVIDAIIEKKSPEDVLSALSDDSVRGVIFTTGTATLKSDLQLMERFKRDHDIPVIASAGIMPFIGQELLDSYPFIDGILLDFTEKDIAAYFKGERSKPLRGMVYRGEGGEIASDVKASRDYSVPVPRHDLFPLGKYRIPLAKRHPFAEVVTSLGCPYSCAFCTAGAYGYRTRDVEGVVEELKMLSGMGVKELLFQDPTFTINTERVKAICRGITDNGLDFTWSCNGDIKALDEEKIKHMRAAGCHTISVGIESGSDEILKKYSKPITVESIKAGVALMNRYRIRVLGYFIVGLPGDDRESILKTIDLARRLNLDYASFAIATPDIGTRLRAEALEQGWISSDDNVFDSTDFPILETDQLSREEVWALRKAAVRKFYLRPSYLMKKVGQLRSWRDIRSAASNALSLFRKS